MLNVGCKVSASNVSIYLVPSTLHVYENRPSVDHGYTSTNACVSYGSVKLVVRASGASTPTPAKYWNRPEPVYQVNTSGAYTCPPCNGCGVATFVFGVGRLRISCRCLQSAVDDEACCVNILLRVVCLRLRFLES